jgi:NDP-sugar pyrophosphorylase family protein
MKAIILAGGLGTRLKPLTDATPKPLLPVRGKPIIQWGVENLAKYGINEIIFSIGYKAEMIKGFFGNGERLGVRIYYNIESEPLGTGGAVKDIVKKFSISEPFVLIWGDNIADFNISEMIKSYERNNAWIAMSLTERDDVENFGVAKLEGEKIAGFVEKPKKEEAPSKLINAGAFIVSPSALDILPEGKSSIEKQCFEILAKEGKVFAQMHKGYWFPTDNLEKYNFAEQEIGRYI